jgi:hypothetical protein
MHNTVRNKALTTKTKTKQKLRQPITADIDDVGARKKNGL